MPLVNFLYLLDENGTWDKVPGCIFCDFDELNFLLFNMKHFLNKKLQQVFNYWKLFDAVGLLGTKPFDGSALN